MNQDNLVSDEHFGFVDIKGLNLKKNCLMQQVFPSQ